MPIDPKILQQLQNNDPLLTSLDLSKNLLSDVDIRDLANVLKANTTLTTLDVSHNQIGAEGAKALATNTTLTTLKMQNNQLGDEGAKALATNTTLTTLNMYNNRIGDEGAKALATNTTLTTLDVSRNQLGVEGAKVLATNKTLTTLNMYNNWIGDEGAKALATNTTLTTLDVSINQLGVEGAKALATNTTLTTLDVSRNQLGVEGAKALATNTTLTTLNVSYNQIGADWAQALTQAIVRNNQQIIKRRDQFIQILVVLAHDQLTKESQSLWSRLPKDLMIHIISLMNFSALESIGKNTQQIKACAAFMFNQASQLKVTLTEAIKTQQTFKIVEKIAHGQSHFRFFPSVPQIESVRAITNQEKSFEEANKIQKIF